MVIDVENARYSDNLEAVLTKLDATKLLRLRYKSLDQGYVAVDALLKDGRVYSYYYSYGSCAACDDWNYRNLSSAQIEEEMLNEATIFDNLEQYEAYRANIVK